MSEKFDQPQEPQDAPSQSSKPHPPERISAVQGNPPADNTGTTQPDEGSLEPPYDPNDLSTRGGQPLPKVVDTPHVIEKYEGSINLEDGPQESGVTRNPKEFPGEEDQEAKPGSLKWRPGGIEKGG